MRDWELVDSDRFSFDDSDRFEEDSLCSWISEPESLCNNWRGWKKSTFNAPNASNGSPPAQFQNAGSSFSTLCVGGKKNSVPDFTVGTNLTSSRTTQLNLVEMAAKCVASHIPFEMVERFYLPVPEQLQLRIAFWSFPEHEEDIRLYSCLANGSAEEFMKGEKLFKNDSVSDILQIGFHLSATVKPNVREGHKVAVTFDRRRVTSCTCTCNSTSNWCGHVVAVCLHRIFQSKDVMLRAPVSESLSRLHRDQLQKFAQYLISELPQQILPTAQRLLDELLSSQRSAINTLRGAPDPTAGSSANEQTTWYLDERTLHGNIHKILIKFCVPAPIVFSDVNYLSSAAPPASAEWSSLLRPLRGREPEGMWNLLSIVREMFRREDRNAVPLLEVITEECLNCDQILVWWFNTKVALHNGNAGHGGKHHSVNSNAHACQHAGSSLCDEIVFLWRLAALNPGLSPDERCILHNQFQEWHLKIIEKISKSRNASVGSKHANTYKNDVEVFPGFRPALEACYLNWDNYPIPGITYSEASQIYHCPFMCFRHSDGHSRSGETGLIHSSHAVLNNPAGEHHLLHSSATIAAPMMVITKRPRSVDFGGERDLSKSSASAAAGAGPLSKSGKTSRNSRKRVDSQNPSPTYNGTGKAKGKESSSSSTNDSNSDPVEDAAVAGPSRNCKTVRSPADLDELTGACSSLSIQRNIANSLQRQPSIDGNRSSISSEGFCENDNEIEIDSSCDKDEGVEIGDNPLLKMNTTSTSEDFDPEDGDNDLDSDSSVSVRIPSHDVPSVPNPVARKSDSSDSQQSGDEYQLYYYDPKQSSASESGSSGGKRTEPNDESAGKKENPNVFTSLRKMDDPWEILFARAEGLHAHGHSKEACKLGVQLAQELLANPPDLSLDGPTIAVGKGKRKRINPASHQVSCLASMTLAKCGFLCTVLAENSDYYYLAFRIGMFGLELARPPASTKPLEVKLANQEAELALLLKKIPIGQKELDMIREKALALRDGICKSRGDALLPLVLANFIFDALVMPNNREGRCTLQSGTLHQTSDEALGFEASVAALGLKANVSEAEHPLLCEGTRRQRGDLALSMLLHYKDDQEKLVKIMDKLLDREIHQLYKSQIPAAYYSNNPPTTTLLSIVGRTEEPKDTVAHSNPSPPCVTPLCLSPSTGAEGASSSKNISSTSNNGDPTIDARTRNQNSANSEAEASGNSGVATSAAQAPNPNGNSSSVSNSAAPMRHGKESSRFKGKRSYPVLPNQPSEAGAHFMFELAKVVLGKAGGSSNQSLFTQPSNGQNPRGPHRALHMCAFHIGLYALGLHNAVSPNWLSRTYSSHVSWITGQAMEIGAPAIAFLIDTWDSHLTPTEAVTIADRASRGDANMVRAAAELALSCLPHAHALNPNELHRAILQCKEQSDGMLEKACTTVESAAKGGGVYPEVLFDVAKQWFSLYQKHLPHVDVDLFSEECSHQENFLIIDGSMDPMNPNHNPNHQMISAQGGHPSSNSNSPPSQPPPPNGPCMPHEGIQMPSHQAIYPLGAPTQIPMNAIPYASAYGPPFIPASFNPVPLAVYPQAIIYESNGSNNSGGPPNAYYTPNGSNHPNQQPPGPPYQNQGMHQIQPMSHHHHASLMTAGAALQYYSPIQNTIQVPITSATGQPYRPGPGFFPVTHLNIHHNSPMNNFNPGQSGNGQSSHQHVAAVVNATGVGMNGHHGSLGGHLVAIPTGNLPQGGQPMVLRSTMPAGASGGHGMERGRGQNMPPQNQMVCGNPLMGHNNHHMVVSNHQMGAHFGGLPLNDGNQNQAQNGRENNNPQPPAMAGNHSSKLKYLLAAYRVGMLAMETLARRVHDDRPAAKFARNPPYGEDVKWLLMISRKLGAQYVQQFCICAVSSIANPFVLHEIILDATFISSRASLAWVYQNPRSPLAPLVQKCQQMYFQCLHQKLYHITLSEYEDFVNIVSTARQAFHLTGDGGSQFKEWLQNLRRSKACKKDLWAQITTALQATNQK